MPTLFKKTAASTETDAREIDSLRNLKLSNEETKEGPKMNSTGLTQEPNEAVVSSTKNLGDDQDFMTISVAVDKQLNEEAQPLIARIEKYLSELSGKTKVDHATYILKELQGLRFDPTCEVPHDPAVYGIVADKIEQYADPQFAAALKTTFGLYTESENARILPKIFASFPKIIKTEPSEKKEDELNNSEAVDYSSPRPK